MAAKQCEVTRTNLVPRAFSALKKGGRINKYSKNRGVFYHVTHEQMAFLEVLTAIARRVCTPKGMVLIPFWSENGYRFLTIIF